MTGVENKIPVNVKITLLYLKKKSKYIHCLWNKFVELIVDSNDPTVGNSLSGVAILVKDADIDKYKYSGYSTGVDIKGNFSFPASGFGKNIKIFGADMSSSAHVDSKKEDILILGEGPTQGLDYTTLTAEKSIQLILPSITKSSV